MKREREKEENSVFAPPFADFFLYNLSDKYLQVDEQIVLRSSLKKGMWREIFFNKFCYSIIYIEYKYRLKTFKNKKKQRKR